MSDHHTGADQPPVPTGPPSTAEVAALTGRLRALSNAVRHHPGDTGAGADAERDGEHQAFARDRDALLNRLPLHRTPEVHDTREDPAMPTNHDTTGHGTTGQETTGYDSTDLAAGHRQGGDGWEQAAAIAERDGFVRVDPAAPGGFRALSSTERRELLESVRATQPAALSAPTHHSDTAHGSTSGQLDSAMPGVVPTPRLSSESLAGESLAGQPDAALGLSSAELLVRAEHADNVTYLGGIGEVEAAYRELEAIEAEASRRAQSQLPGDVALAAYVGLLIEDPGVERFEEFTAAYNAAHHTLDVPAATTPTDPDSAAAADTDAYERGGRERGTDALVEHQARFPVDEEARRERVVAVMGEPDPVADAAARAARIEHAEGAASPAARAAWAEHSRLFDTHIDSPADQDLDGSGWELGADAARWSPDLHNRRIDAAATADLPEQQGALAVYDSADLAAIDREAAQDRADRADPGLSRLVEARDYSAAGGRFADADSQQRLIDAARDRSQQAPEHHATVSAGQRDESHDQARAATTPDPVDRARAACDAARTAGQAREANHHDRDGDGDGGAHQTYTDPQGDADRAADDGGSDGWGYSYNGSDGDGGRV